MVVAELEHAAVLDGGGHVEHLGAGAPVDAAAVLRAPGVPAEDRILALAAGARVGGKWRDDEYGNAGDARGRDEGVQLHGNEWDVGEVEGSCAGE